MWLPILIYAFLSGVQPSDWQMLPTPTVDIRIELEDAVELLHGTTYQVDMRRAV